MKKKTMLELKRLDVEQYHSVEKIPLVVVLDDVRSLNNIGSIFRTSDAFLVDKIFLCGITATPPSPDIHKTALGAEFTVDWQRVDNPVEALAPTFAKLSYSNMFSGSLPVVFGTIFAIISFLFVDLFDSLGVFLGIAPKAGLVDENGKTQGAGKALFVSAGAAAVGAILGTSTVSIYGAESATGIAEGGRTGLTACCTGLLFLLTLFLSPLFLMIPAIATAPALIMVGIFMMEPLSTLDLSDFSVSMPAFFAVAAMPFTYNIAYGVLFAMLSYSLCKVATGKRKDLSPAMVVLTFIFLLYIVLDAIF